MSQHELVEMSQEGTKELFQYLIENRAKDQITNALGKWLKDQLDIIGKFDIVAEDINTINFIRGKGFKEFIPLYTSDINIAMALVQEIDNYIIGSITSGTDTYIDILKEQIRKREEQLLEAQSIAKLGSYEWNLQEQKSVSSPELYQIFELESAGQYETFMTHVHPADKKKVEDTMTAALSTGYYECEYRYLAASGQKYVWARGVIEFKHEKPYLLKGTVQDITQRKQIEDELLQKTMELERSNESLQQFASIASHDLKEPLRKIAMFSDLIITSELEKLSPGSQSHLLRVKESAQRLQRMIEDILSYSSLSKGNDKQCYSLEKLVDEVRETLYLPITEKGAAVVTDGLPDAEMSPSQFRQVFQNLLSNSLKFAKSSESPVIKISHYYLKHGELEEEILQDAPAYIVINIEDNGIGFKPEYAEHIFGLFNRLHNRATYEGTGIGLAITRKIIENHGGSIKAEALSNGARFKIILPYKISNFAAKDSIETSKSTQ